MRRRNAVGKGELYVIPYVPSDSNGTSAQPSPSIVFHEACFKIIDPQCEKEDGDILQFGDEVCILMTYLIILFNVHALYTYCVRLCMLSNFYTVLHHINR
jgi:hypothetical protein